MQIGDILYDTIFFNQWEYELISIEEPFCTVKIRKSPDNYRIGEIRSHCFLENFRVKAFRSHPLTDFFKKNS
jgi:hypothetical protein